jgi:hypothetical protein
VLRVTIMIAPIKGVMAEPAGRLTDVQVRTRAEEDGYGVPTPGARATELGAADLGLETAGQRWRESNRRQSTVFRMIQ